VAGPAEHPTGIDRSSDSRFRVTLEPLDAGRTAAAVSAPGCGAVATFVGLVRDHNLGRRVLYLDYECYEPLAVKAFRRIAGETEAEWPAARLAIEHRVGPLQVGDASVVIAAASPHRAEAFAACRYAIERIKQIAPQQRAFTIVHHPDHCRVEPRETVVPTGGTLARVTGAAGHRRCTAATAIAVIGTPQVKRARVGDQTGLASRQFRCQRP
jgi:molybdopterin synthase catalytic subunit